MINNNETKKTEVPDMMNHEFDLLLEIARDRNTHDLKVKLIRFSEYDFDWDYLLQLAQYHGMQVPLYFALSKLDENLVPAEVLQTLKNVYFENGKQNISLLVELLKLIKYFEERDVSIIPFKGPILSYSLYNNYSVRPPGDMDILVRPDDVLPIVEYLKKLGFQEENPISRNQLIALIKISRQNRINLVNPKNKLIIEIHWRFYISDIIGKKDTDFIWKHTYRSEINNADISVFNPEITLLFLCFHLYKHNWGRLNWIRDLSKFIQNNPQLDWDWIILHADKFGGTKILLVSLQIARKFLNFSVPPQLDFISMDNKYSSDILNQLNVEPTKPALELEIGDENFGIRSRFLIKPKMRNRILQFLKFSFMPNYFDISSVDLPSFLYPLYYLIRPLRLIFTNSKERLKI